MVASTAVPTRFEAVTLYERPHWDGLVGIDRRFEWSIGSHMERLDTPSHHLPDWHCIQMPELENQRILVTGVAVHSRSHHSSKSTAKHSLSRSVSILAN